MISGASLEASFTDIMLRTKKFMFLEKNHILFHEVTLKNENWDISQEHTIDDN